MNIASFTVGFLLALATIAQSQELVKHQPTIKVSDTEKVKVRDAQLNSAGIMLQMSRTESAYRNMQDALIKAQADEQKAVADLSAKLKCEIDPATIECKVKPEAKEPTAKPANDTKN